MILKTLFWRYFVVPRVRTAELDLRQPWKTVGDFQRGTKLRYETYSNNGFTPQLHVAIGHFGKYHNTFCLSPQILHKHCFQFLLGLKMVPKENENNAYAKFGWTNKEYYGIFRGGLLGAVTEQAWCADLKLMVQAVIGRVHACSMGPRYVKCLRPKKERGAITKKRFTRTKRIIIHEG